MIHKGSVLSFMMRTKALALISLMIQIARIRNYQCKNQHMMMIRCSIVIQDAQNSWSIKSFRICWHLGNMLHLDKQCIDRVMKREWLPKKMGLWQQQMKNYTLVILNMLRARINLKDSSKGLKFKAAFTLVSKLTYLHLF